MSSKKTVVKPTVLSAARRAEIGHERRARTRHRLFTAAAKLVAMRGTEGLTIDDFAKAAGVTRGTFYKYFQTRDELLGELWRHSAKSWLDKIQRCHGPDEDVAFRLTCGMRLVIRKAFKDNIWGWLMYRVASSHADHSAEMHDFPLADIRLGFESGRFSGKENEEAICDMVAGGIVMAIKAVMTTERPADYAERCSFVALRGLGLTKTDARSVIARPLPEIPA